MLGLNIVYIINIVYSTTKQTVQNATASKLQVAV